MKTSVQLSRQLSDGAETQVLIQPHADRTFVLITQLEKVGHLIQASLPPTVPLLPPPAADSDHPNILPLPEPPAGISLTSLFGAAPSQHYQTLHELYAAQIATIIWTTESEGPLNVARRDVLIGISLKKTPTTDVDGIATQPTEIERKVFREVMGMLYEALRS